MEFLLLAGPWFWIAAIPCAVVLLVAAMAERTGWSTFAILCVVLSVHFLAGVNVWHAIATHPLYIVGGFIGWFVMGILWSWLKWFALVKREASRIREIRDKFLESYGTEMGSAQPDIMVKCWNHIADKVGYWGGDHADPAKVIELAKPKPSDNKERIIFWIGYWPLSMILTLIDDPLRRLADALYRWVSGMFSRMSDQAFKGLDGH
jgi:hypothetical protein